MSHSDVFTLGRGTHLYDFAIDLPGNLPATFKLDSWATVRYSISAYLQARISSLSLSLFYVSRTLSVSLSPSLTLFHLFINPT